jgi:hypothetical protein
MGDSPHPAGLEQSAEFRLGLRMIVIHQGLAQISRIKNPWDRNVALKQALGVPADRFTRAETLLPHVAAGSR